jgi:predicted kinase
MKTFGIFASAASILSFLVALLLLPAKYSSWGYTVAAIALACLISAAAYEVGLSRRAPVKTTNPELFASRDELLERWPYRSMIFDGEGTLRVLGGTLRSFVTEAHLDWLRDFLSEHATNSIELLIMNPASEGAYLRAQEELRVTRIYHDLNASFAALLKFQASLSTDDRKRVSIRKYSALPSMSMFARRDRIAYTHYLHDRSSTSSTWYLLDNDDATTDFFGKLERHFESLSQVADDLAAPDNYAIIFVGPPGSGKTTVATLLHEELEESRLISSASLRNETGLLDIFSDIQRGAIQKIIGGDILSRIAQGNRRLIIDSNLYPRSVRDRIVAQLRALHVDVYLFRIGAASDELVERIAEKCINDDLYKRLGMTPVDILARGTGLMGDAHLVPAQGVKAEFTYDTSRNNIAIRAADEVSAFFARDFAARIGKSFPSNMTLQLGDFGSDI